MEAFDPVWIFGGIAFVAGILLGYLVCRKTPPTIAEVDALRVKLERARDEMEQYRASVSGHFNKTSHLVKDLTDGYVKVYRHLAEGAQSLSDAPEFTQLLEQQKDRVLVSTVAETTSSQGNESPLEAVSAPEEQASAQDVPAPGNEAGTEPPVEADAQAESPVGSDSSTQAPTPDDPGQTETYEVPEEKTRASVDGEEKREKIDASARTDTQ